MDETIKKKRFDGSEVEILGETYEEGSTGQGDKDNWQDKLDDRDDIIKFLETGLRYWWRIGPWVLNC